MKKNKLLLGFMTTVLGLTLVACGSKQTSSESNPKKTEKVTIVGSTALQPLVEKAASQFESDHPGANITVQGGGSGTGLSQVQSGAV